MLRIGDKVRFLCDPKGDQGEVLTIKYVSPILSDVQQDYMVETEEYAPGYTWASGMVLIESAPALDTLDEQLNFLGF
jgi:hypothetical protein